VITVGASRLVDASSGRLWEGTYSYGNYGSCIDIFAPGVNIFGACGGKGDEYLLALFCCLSVQDPKPLVIESAVAAVALRLWQPERCERVQRDAYTLASGTSMAVPHVAGVAALYLSRHPLASPEQVKNAILAGGTPDVFDPSRVQLIYGTPNLMLYAPAGCSNE
jgi:subtilisin family serine protease